MLLSKDGIFAALFRVVLILQFTLRSGLAAESPVEVGAGSVQVPAFTLPPSALISPEARQLFYEPPSSWEWAPFSECPLPKNKNDKAALQLALRECHDKRMTPKLEAAKARYEVTIEPRSIAGVKTYDVLPKEGVTAKNHQRVLIQLPGSAYFLNTHITAQLYAIPMAANGKIRVVGIDYRKGPEYRHPAAVEDLANVYKVLLKTYPPKNIGIYGCSAGGVITAEMPGRVIKENLAVPGAIVMEGSAAGAADRANLAPGDSVYIGYVLSGDKPMTLERWKEVSLFSGYMSIEDYSDPSFVPIISPTLLEGFPPSLLITSTRDVPMSDVIFTHMQLVRAGREAELHVFEGLPHCGWREDRTPEHEHYQNILLDFFDRHLGVKAETQAE